MTQNNDTRDIVGTVAHMKKNGSLKFLIIALCVGAVLFLVGSLALLDAGSSYSLVGVDVNQFPFGVPQQFCLVPFNLVFKGVNLSLMLGGYAGVKYHADFLHSFHLCCSFQYVFCVMVV